VIAWVGNATSYQLTRETLHAWDERTGIDVCITRAGIGASSLDPYPAWRGPARPTSCRTNSRPDLCRRPSPPSAPACARLDARQPVLAHMPEPGAASGAPTVVSRRRVHHRGGSRDVVRRARGEFADDSGVAVRLRSHDAAQGCRVARGFAPRAEHRHDDANPPGSHCAQDPSAARSSPRRRTAAFGGGRLRPPWRQPPGPVERRQKAGIDG